MRIADRGILITAAGSGIGRELPYRFGAAGCPPALVGRRVGALEETAAEVRDRVRPPQHLITVAGTEGDWS